MKILISHYSVIIYSKHVQRHGRRVVDIFDIVLVADVDKRSVHFDGS